MTQGITVGRVERSATRHSFHVTAGNASLTRPTLL
jgi:hypothetical protein